MLSWTTAARRRALGCRSGTPSSWSFGNPLAGTPVMGASPLAALDLPLKVLVWADDEGTVWMSYLAAEWLAGRHGIAAELTKPLAAPDSLTSRVAMTS